MSFILDALKKSEIERQRQSVPGLMDARVAPRRNRLPVWAIALGVLLGVNLLALTFILTRKSAPAASTVSQPAAASSVSHLPPAPPHSAGALQSVGSGAGVSRLKFRSTAAPDNPAIGRRRTRRRRPGKPAHIEPADPVLTDPDAGAESQEVLPSMNELSLTRCASPAGAASRRACVCDEALGAFRVHQHAQVSRGFHSAGGARRRTHPTRRSGAELSRPAVPSAAAAVEGRVLEGIHHL